MNGTNAPLIFSVIFLFLMLLAGSVLILKILDNQEKKYQANLNYLLTQNREILTGHLELLDKTVTLLSTADPLAFQQIQAMNPNQMNLEQSLISDPSDLTFAYQEANEKGMVFNPDSLEDDEAYDADEIQRFFLGADGAPR